MLKIEIASMSGLRKSLDAHTHLRHWPAPLVLAPRRRWRYSHDHTFNLKVAAPAACRSIRLKEYQYLTDMGTWWITRTTTLTNVYLLSLKAVLARNDPVHTTNDPTTTNETKITMSL